MRRLKTGKICPVFSWRFLAHRCIINGDAAGNKRDSHVIICRMPFRHGEGQPRLLMKRRRIGSIAPIGEKTPGKQQGRFSTSRVSCAILIGLPFFTCCCRSASSDECSPCWRGSIIRAVLNISPNLERFCSGLSSYTAAFPPSAEIVRAGIQAISKGQTEAAMVDRLDRLRSQSGHILRGVAGDYSAFDESRCESDKEQLSRGCDWISNFVSVASTTIIRRGQALKGFRFDHGRLSLLQFAGRRFS